VPRSKASMQTAGTAIPRSKAAMQTVATTICQTAAATILGIVIQIAIAALWG
jgi:hypothetical protein